MQAIGLKNKAVIPLKIYRSILSFISTINNNQTIPERRLTNRETSDKMQERMEGLEQLGGCSKGFEIKRPQSRLAEENKAQ